MHSTLEVLKNIFRVPYLRGSLVLAALFAATLPVYETYVNYPRFSAFLVATVEDEANRTARHFASMLMPEATEFSVESLPKNLRQEAANLERDFGLEKIKIFAPSGEIIYSSDPEDEGTINTRDYFVDIVATGRGYTKIVEKQSLSLEGQAYEADVVETYVPVMDGGKFQGAFEIYYDITKQKQLLGKLRLKSAGTSLGLALGLFVIVVVITYRASSNMLAEQEAEAALRQAQKMQSLGNMAAGIAHEMNNLLLPIMALGQMTLNRLPEDSPHRESMRKIIEASERGKVLVEQVMAFNRIEETKREKLDIHEVLSDSIDFIRSSIWTTIKLDVDLNGHVGMVCGDADQLRIVLMNLVSNAQDAIGRMTGTIAISLSRTEIGSGDLEGFPALGPGHYAKLTVSDTGSGMDSKTKERALDPFFTTKEVGNGVGLGLSTVYTIVTNHHGGIRITSQIGSGTVVEVLLPLA